MKSWLDELLVRLGILAAGMLLGLAAGEVQSETLRADDGQGTVIHLLDAKCVDEKILAMLKPEFRTDAKQALGDFDMVDNYGRPAGTVAAKGCWVVLPNDNYGTIWEDEDSYEHPRKAFQPEAI